MIGSSSDTSTAKARVLVSGANGYIGQVLCDQLRDRGYVVRAAVRSLDKAPQSAPEPVAIGDINQETNWQTALQDVDFVVHLAARAHVQDKKPETALTAFRETNVAGTRRLVEQATHARIRRLVFVSSIGVHGDTSGDSPFNESSPVRPVRPYQIAKWEAEQVLAEYQDRLDFVIVRPPLVYGPHAPGNLSRLIRLIQQGIPLPFAGIRNQRSLVGVRNLVHFLEHCMISPLASRKTFVICDGEDLSTPELVMRLSNALNLQARLFAVPEWNVRLAARSLGKQRLVDQLWGTLQVDAARARTQLDWVPPCSVDEEMAWLARQATGTGLT